MQTEYLKNSFRMEEFTEFDIGEMRAGYRADEDGLTMWKGHYLTREAEARISWVYRLYTSSVSTLSSAECLIAFIFATHFI